MSETPIVKRRGNNRIGHLPSARRRGVRPVSLLVEMAWPNRLVVRSILSTKPEEAV